MEGKPPTHHFKFDTGSLVADRYEIRSVLGKGGMGEVYLAHDKQTNQDVALKTLHTKYASSKHAIARFVREVKLAKQLNHPGIVKILDAQRWGSTLFYTMDFLDGKSLRQWMQQKRQLDVNSTVRVLCLVAEALEHAHTITIHRDLSPENVMVLRDGSIRLLDFGLAKLDDQFKGLTSIGVNLGKLRYMAPEQEQNAAEVDHRADLYPLGVMFFEMLTGRAPQQMGNAIAAQQEDHTKFMDILTGRASVPHQSICAARPDLPKEADAFLDKALARNPDNRFSSAREFRDALMQVYRAYKAMPPPGTVQEQAVPEEPETKSGILGRIGAFLSRLFRRKGD